MVLEAPCVGYYCRSQVTRTDRAVYTYEILNWLSGQAAA